MNTPNPRSARLRLPPVLLSALLLLLFQAARSTETDALMESFVPRPDARVQGNCKALIEALAPRLDELARLTGDSRWPSTTGNNDAWEAAISKKSLAKFYGLPWPLPETKMTREQLDREMAVVNNSVPKVPDWAELVAAIDRQYPLLKVGDRVEFTATKAGGEQQVRGTVTAIRPARSLSGGGRLDAYVAIDETDVWQKADLPNEVNARFFPDAREEWIRKAFPALVSRFEAFRADALAKIPERIEKLREVSGLIRVPDALGVPESTLLTKAEADEILDGLANDARSRETEIYARAKVKAQYEYAEDARREIEAQGAAQEQVRRQQRMAAAQAAQYSESSQGRTGGAQVITVPGWVRTRGDAQGFLDVINEGTTGR